MSTISRVSLLTLTSLAVAAAGCASRKFNNPGSGVRDTSAAGAATALSLKVIPGTPIAIAMGHQEKFQSENYIDFVIFPMNPPGQAAAPQEKILPSKVLIDVDGGSELSSTQLPGFSVPLQQGDHSYYGASYRSSSPVDCNKALTVVLGPDVAKVDDGTLCRLELNSTGAAELPYDELTKCEDGKCISQTDYGIYVSFIPVGPGETGFPKGVPAKDFPSTETADLKSGPPSKNNQLVDPAFLDHLKAVRKKFAVSESYSNSCLMNARAWQWTDLASHYYCQLPYDSARTCYSSNLVVGRQQALLKLVAELKKEGKPGPDTAAVVKVTLGAMNAAYETCFVKGEKGVSPQAAGSDVVKWFSNSENAAAFKYAMFTVQYVRDFNVNSENEIINKFYMDENIPRRRRATDVWPEMGAKDWPLGQPRYSLIRGVQQAFSSPPSSGSGGGTAP